MFKTIKLFLLMVITLPLLVTCDLFNARTPELQGNFWASNARTGARYRVDAELLASNDYCEVWVEKSCTVANVGIARQVADEYEEIYDKFFSEVSGVFDIEVDFDMVAALYGNNVDFPKDRTMNLMEFAGWLIGGDGKLTILLLDIRDNYKEGVFEAYVAGYFFLGISGEIQGFLIDRMNAL